MSGTAILREREGTEARAARWRRSAWPVLLVVATGCVYANCCRGPFVLDDLPNILENEHIRSIGSSWRSAFDRQRLDVTLAGRPVAAVTFAMNWAISDAAIWSYRLVNVLVHAAAALALYGIVRRTLLLRGHERPNASAPILAFAVALVWAVHPLHVTSVTYVVQRVESLGGFMILLTLYCFIRGSTGGSERWFIGAVTACAVGVGVKETSAVAPIIVLLYDRTFLAGSFPHALRSRRSLYAALAATWLVFGALLLASPRSGLFQTSFDAQLGYLRTQCWAVLHYLRLSIWPVGTVLDYGGPAVGTLPGAHVREWMPGAAVLAAVLAATILALARRWPSGFVGACFFLILLPSSSIIPIPMEAAAEHRMYLPLACVAVIAVIGVARVVPARAHGAVLGVCVLVSIVFGRLTLQRNTLFQDELALWSSDVARQPNNARTRTALGVALFERQRYDDAIEQHRAAIDVQPTYAEAWHNLGDALLRTRHPHAAEQAYRRALALPPPSYKTHYNYAQLLMTQRRFADAAQQFEHAVTLSDSDPRLWNALGFARANAGHLERAVECFRRALQIEPEFADAKRNLDHVERLLRSK